MDIKVMSLCNEYTDEQIAKISSGVQGAVVDNLNHKITVTLKGGSTYDIQFNPLREVSTIISTQDTTTKVTTLTAVYSDGEREVIATIEPLKGDAGEITIGTVETVDEGENPSITNAGTKSEAVLNFKLPRAKANTIRVGAVTHSETDEPSVTNSGTENDATFNFTLKDGYSPRVSINEDTDSSFKLEITTADGDTITPNLRGRSAHWITGTAITGLDNDISATISGAEIGDMYLNTSTNIIYKQFSEGHWKYVCSIKGETGDSNYDIAVRNGFQGTEPEYLASLVGVSALTEKVWEKPDIRDENTSLGTWYMYKVDNGEVGNAWLNKFKVPDYKDFVPGKYCYFDGIQYLVWLVEHAVLPSQSQKDLYEFYVIYDEVNMTAVAHTVVKATGEDITHGTSDISTSYVKPDDAEEIIGTTYQQLGTWCQTNYIGATKETAVEVTIQSGFNVQGFVGTDYFLRVVGDIQNLIVSNSDTLVESINDHETLLRGENINATLNTESKNVVNAINEHELLLRGNNTGSLSTVSKNVIGAINEINGKTANLLNMFYPVGTIYQSTSFSFNPNVTWGGTWERIKDRFLIGVGDNHSAGETGGSETKTISVDNLPPHYHQLYGCAWNWGMSQQPWLVTINESVRSGTSSVGNALSSLQGIYNFTKTDVNNGEVTQTDMDIMPPYMAVYMWRRTR